MKALGQELIDNMWLYAQTNIRDIVGDEEKHTRFWFGVVGVVSSDDLYKVTNQLTKFQIRKCLRYIDQGWI